MPRKKNRAPLAGKKPAYIIGHVDYVNPAYAYIIPQEKGHADILVKQENLLRALHKDLVKVLVLRYNKSNKRFLGRVVKVIKRNPSLLVGRLVCQEKSYFAVPDGRRMHHNIFVDTAELKGAKQNDKIVVKVTGWSNNAPYPTGVIQKVLGPAGMHEVEMHAIMAEFELPDCFSEQVIEESRAIPTTIPKHALSGRRDFRDVPTVTIDPEDAKDFDDALSFKKLPNGHYEVGIHIADVSYYVQEGSLLDREALERCTSVYLVDRVIPMLPEKLSNEVCSLRPGEDKLTFSAVFELDSQGNVHQEWLGETIIRSDQRLTYEEAQQMITSQEGPFCEMLTVLNQLAKQLRNKRFEKGSIVLESTEIKFQLDAQGKPLHMTPKVIQDTHKLVEEWMLLANKQVASRVFHMRPGKHPPTFVYRTHDSPDLGKLSNFWDLVRLLGYRIDTQSQSISQALNALMKKVSGQAIENTFQSFAMHTMAKAFYTTEAKSHFGLAFEHYTHFTSPIRRYPDVMVHRLLKQYLKGHFGVKTRSYETICYYASEKERTATNAERASTRYKQVELMQTRLGTVLAGIISGITSRKIYVEIIENRCEGMVRLVDMRDDYYEEYYKGFRVVGVRTRKVYQVGDRVLVQVKKCDLAKRTISLAFVSERNK